MRSLSDCSNFNPERVASFVQEFASFTWHRSEVNRTAELDARIGGATLSLADKIEAFRRLAAPGWTSFRDELRMERLLCSIAAEDLLLFKFAVEYDGDYKDLEEYLCHDIDNEGCRSRVLDHLRSARSESGVKVLSDVDDTMYANLFDDRYPRKAVKKSFYPGVLEFYDALKREPFTIEGIPVTTLSARPNPVAGISEEASLGKLMEYSDRQLRPSALSGALVSSTIGTFQTFFRTRLAKFVELLPHGQEDEIGVVKFKNFANFAAVYPEYHYVFVGDSGQADALTAQLMLAADVSEGSGRVITTFVHDLRRFSEDHASPAFAGLPDDMRVTRESASGRGVIVFRNYIEAAVIAFTHAASLGNLIEPEGLARITRAALKQFETIDFTPEGKEASRDRLRQQYREAAEDACQLLAASGHGTPALVQDLWDVRQMLDVQGSTH